MDVQPVTDKSHRIIVPRRGSPDVLQRIDESLPRAGSGEVRVRVEAAGVSAYDVMLRGHRFPAFTRVPYTPGEDIVGVVDQIGDGVTGLQTGQRVGGWTFGKGGGYASHLCCPAADLVPVPDGLDPTLAVALIANYLTASLALHQAAKVQPGERIVIQGAGGGLGSALLQLGRAAALETYGCDFASKHSQIREDGATAIDCLEPDVAARIRELTGGGTDAVFDLVGGARQLIRSWRSLHSEGRLIMLGMAGTLQSGTGIILPSLVLLGVLSLLPGKRSVVTGPGMESYPRAHPQWYRDTLVELFRLALQGQLQPRIARRLPLSDAATAHSLLETGQIAGKLVLVGDA